MKKLRVVLAKSAGVSLVEVMMAAGLVAVLGLGVSAIVNTMNRGYRGAQQKSDLLTLQNAFNQISLNPSFCKKVGGFLIGDPDTIALNTPAPLPKLEYQPDGTPAPPPVVLASVNNPLPGGDPLVLVDRIQQVVLERSGATTSAGQPGTKLLVKYDVFFRKEKPANPDAGESQGAALGPSHFNENRPVTTRVTMIFNTATNAFDGCEDTGASASLKCEDFGFTTISMSASPRCGGPISLTGNVTVNGNLAVQGNLPGNGNLQAPRVYSPGFIEADGATLPSDARLKGEVERLEGALGKVLELQGSSFVWKSGAAAGQRGFGVIAQDVEKVFPEAVFQRQDGRKSVNYQILIAPLIEAVRELKSENDSLRRSIQDQGERLRLMEKERR